MSTTRNLAPFALFGAVLAAAGIALAWLLSGSVSALLGTAYGLGLLAKVAVVVGLLGLAALVDNAALLRRVDLYLWCQWRGRLWRRDGHKAAAARVSEGAHGCCAWCASGAGALMHAAALCTLP